MAAADVRINEAGFVPVERNCVVAIIPSGSFDQVITAVEASGAATADIQALRGEDGLPIFEASRHGGGFWSSVLHALEGRVGSPNEPENYSGALRHGDDIVAIACDDYDTAVTYGSAIDKNGGERPLFFRQGTMTQLF